MDNKEQIFKSTGYQWSQFHIAYSNEELKNAPTRYMNFEGYMEDVNKAIDEAGILEISRITENPSIDWSFRLSTRLDKLEGFTEKVHMDACTLIENPFGSGIQALMESVVGHSEFTVNYNNEVYTLEVDEVGEEYIDQLFQSLIESNDIDSKEYTGNENVDKYIREYQKFDPSSRAYGYEIAMDNWNNLNTDQKEALRHMVEYNYRVMEKNVDPNSAEGLVAQATLNNMAKHMYNKELPPEGFEELSTEHVTGSDAAKGIRDLLDSKKAHSFEAMDAVANMDFNAYIYEKDADGKETDYAYPAVGTATLEFDYDKAGIRLNLHNEWYCEAQAETYYKDYQIDYYTSLSRSLKYVDYQEEKHPGCYDHLNSIGVSNALIADYLTMADSKKDMDVIDRMTKSTGQSFDNIFVGDPAEMTVSGMGAVVLHNYVLSELWYKDRNEAARQEAANMNRFFLKGTSKYSGDYYNYYCAAEYQMYTGELTDDPSMSIPEAFLRGVESEFIVWPMAINTALQKANEQGVVYMSLEDSSKIGLVSGTFDPELNREQYDTIRWGMNLEDKPIQERLKVYKYVGENYQVTGEMLNGTALKDLRNIYYSYLNYATEQKINLQFTEKEQKVLDELYTILYNNDAVFRGSEDLKYESQKMSQAQREHPVAFGAGKVVADGVIYYGIGIATAGMGAGLEGAIGGFAANVVKGTVVDIVIKDIPRAITSYSQGEDLQTVAKEFTNELVYDIAGNVGGELIGRGINYAVDSFDAKRGAELLTEYMNAANKSEILENLSKRDLARMLSQMGEEATAEVLSRYSDDMAKAVLEMLDPVQAARVAEKMGISLQKSGGQALSGAIDVDDAISQGKNIRQLDIIDEMGIEKHLDGTVDTATKDITETIDDVASAPKDIEIKNKNEVPVPPKYDDAGEVFYEDLYARQREVIPEYDDYLHDLSDHIDSVPEASIERELYKEQGEMAEEAFNAAKAPGEIDARGNVYKPLSRDEARALSDKLKYQIDDVPNVQRGNYRVPEPEKIKGVKIDPEGNVRIVEAWKENTDGALANTRRMEIVKATNSDGSPTIIDRVGGESGDYFSPMKPNGEPYSLQERAIGDYLPEKRLQDNASYHQYEVQQDFTRENFEKAIRDTYDNPKEVADKLEQLEAYYEDATSDIGTYGHDGEKYCDVLSSEADGVKAGEIDQMFLKDGDGYMKGTDGGAQQFITPFNAKDLLKMRMIKEIGR